LSSTSLLTFILNSQLLSYLFFPTSLPTALPTSLLPTSHSTSLFIIISPSFTPPQFSYLPMPLPTSLYALCELNNFMSVDFAQDERLFFNESNPVLNKFS
jgi:hypothetical protein